VSYGSSTESDSNPLSLPPLSLFATSALSSIRADSRPLSLSLSLSPSFILSLFLSLFLSLSLFALGQVESQGTVLSTDWKDVGSKKVDAK